jgi:NAD(P)-dependent dehydrogenase (short-subunit alcohol dehydrogenase family)
MPKGGKGKFVVLGSRAGVLGMPKVVAAGAYGQSKAAVHFLVSSISWPLDVSQVRRHVLMGL